MLKTLLAGTAAATILAFAAQAQEAPATEAEEAPEAIPHSEMMPPREVGDQQMPSEIGESQEPAPPAAEEPAAPQTAEEAAPPDTIAPDTSPDAASETAADAPPPMGTLPEGWTPVDLATVTPDMLIGADVRTYEGDTIASVEDVLMSAEGKVDNVAVRFGGLLGFGETKVLLAPAEIAVATDADGNVAVLTSLTSEDLKGRPEYVVPEGTDAAG
jgi:hypothetical protein